MAQPHGAAYTHPESYEIPYRLRHFETGTRKTLLHALLCAPGAPYRNNELKPCEGAGSHMAHALRCFEHALQSQSLAKRKCERL
jgi:hypothetical protein